MDVVTIGGYVALGLAFIINIYNAISYHAGYIGYLNSAPGAAHSEKVDRNISLLIAFLTLLGAALSYWASNNL